MAWHLLLCASLAQGHILLIVFQIIGFDARFPNQNQYVVVPQWRELSERYYLTYLEQSTAGRTMSITTSAS